MSDEARGDGTTTHVDYEEAEEVPKSWFGRQLEGVNTLLAAVLIALAVRAFVIEPFRIPSESMLPTLLIGDHLFVNKFIYGIKLPFTDTRLPAIREPQRGDVVVFTVARDGRAIYPADLRPDLRREEFVKRIVGVPGDTISVEQGVLRVNGKVVPETPLKARFDDGMGRSLFQRREEVDGRSYTVLDDPVLSGLQQPPFRVPPGRYFMMGDNRDHSDDSRDWGTVKLAQMKGPAFVLYWSWNWDGSWLELANPVTWVRLLTQETRWGRIGSPID